MKQHVCLWSLCLSAACAGAADPPDPVEASPTTSSILSVYMLTWQPDDGDEVDVELESVAHVTTAGDNCQPSLLVHGGGSQGAAVGGVNLYFDRPPAPGVVTALPDLSTPSAHTLYVRVLEPVKVQYVFGGRVTVVGFTPEAWEFRFDGDGLTVCVDGKEVCEPLVGGTLTVEPIDHAAAVGAVLRGRAVRLAGWLGRLRELRRAVHEW